jgi:hypothetical protein
LSMGSMGHGIVECKILPAAGVFEQRGQTWG